MCRGYNNANTTKLRTYLNLLWVRASVVSWEGREGAGRRTTGYYHYHQRHFHQRHYHQRHWMLPHNHSREEAHWLKRLTRDLGPTILFCGRIPHIVRYQYRVSKETKDTDADRYTKIHEEAPEEAHEEARIHLPIFPLLSLFL